MEGLELASKVSTTESYTLGDENAGVKIAVMDFGTKRNILRCFVDRGCYVKVFNARATYADMQAWGPDGYFLSNGPGDPSTMDYAVATVKEILAGGHPLFGICLGHQLLALACDIPTYKMHHGHRGINHPVQNTISGRCEITSQNHGFGIATEPVESSDRLVVSHRNLNDKTIEGIKLKDYPAYSVQYHPESNPGPHDSRYLFDDFVELIKGHRS
jgi:carbamoyl-phosphate synthase small subunit